MPRFVDTNILVYAEDRDAGEKHHRAVELIRDLWERADGVVSIQVLQEFFVTITRKVGRPKQPQAAAQIVEQYLTWQTVENDGQLLLSAIEWMRRYQLSFWDALVVRAAALAGCHTLYSEDLSHGQRFGELEVVNPFRA